MGGTRGPGTRYWRIKTISSVKFSAAPLASRPDLVNICEGSCCVDMLTRCSHQLARAQTWLMMPGAGVMIMKRSRAALKNAATIKLGKIERRWTFHDGISTQLQCRG